MRCRCCALMLALVHRFLRVTKQFWSDVEQFRSPDTTAMFDEATVWQLGRDIFAKYVKSGASLEVNIPSDIRLELVEFFEKQGPSGFNPRASAIAAGDIAAARAGASAGRDEKEHSALDGTHHIVAVRASLGGAATTA